MKNVRIEFIILDCISNANNVPNDFHIDGCARQLGKLSVGQTLGLAVINSFLFVLALVAIPLLMEMDSQGNSHGNSSESEFVNQPMQQFPQQYPQQYPGYSAAPYNPGLSYNTYNPTSAAYY